jgi:hypothetical protein
MEMRVHSFVWGEEVYLLLLCLTHTRILRISLQNVGRIFSSPGISGQEIYGGEGDEVGSSSGASTREGSLWSLCEGRKERGVGSGSGWSIDPFLRCLNESRMMMMRSQPPFVLLLLEAGNGNRIRVLEEPCSILDPRTSTLTQ